MLGIDSGWHPLLIALFGAFNTVLITLGLFKTQVGLSIVNWVTGLFRLKSDQQEHVQGLESATLKKRLRANATPELREAWREEQYLEMLREFFQRDVQELKDGQAATTREIAELRKDIQAGRAEAREDQKASLAAIGQTNNLLKELTITLTRRGNG